VGAFGARAGRGVASLYTKGSVVRPRFGAFDVWVHGFFRTMCIRYVTLGHYHIRWWYWSKKRSDLTVFCRPFTTHSKVIDS